MAIDTDYIQSQARSLAEYEVQRERAQVKRNETKYKAQLAGVNTLDKALKDLGSAVKGLKGTDKSMLINAAKFSKEDMASATLGASAKSGNYSFFVEQLASRHQLALGSLGDDVSSASGTLKIEQDGKSFEVDLSAGGKLSQEDLASAINKHPDNKGVKATLVRSGGQVTLMLTANESGQKNAISLSTTATGSSLSSSLANHKKELSKAQNAVVYLGVDASGMRLEHDSNTFKDVIDGVSLTFNATHKTGEQALSVDISRDQTATKDKLNEFVTAINAMLGTFDTLTAAGGEKGSRGALAGDSSIRAVETMLNKVLRTPFGGVTLMEFGILSDAKGLLKVDNKAFEKKLDSDPDAFEKLFSGQGNLIDSLDKQLGTYTSASSGSMKARKENINALLKRVDDKRADLDIKYQSHFQRYLKQYTNMAQLMSSMEQTFTMFG